MKLTHNVNFSPFDPLDDGLRDAIIAEQAEDDAMSLDEPIDEDKLTSYWKEVEQDLESDPSWFKFDDDAA